MFQTPEDVLKEEERKYDSLKKQLLDKKNEFKQVQDQNKLFALYKLICNGIQYNFTNYKLQDVVNECNDFDIPIPDELQDVVKESNDLDRELTSSNRNLVTVINLLLGPGNYDKIKDDEKELNKILDEYIQISHEL